MTNTQEKLEYKRKGRGEYSKLKKNGWRDLLKARQPFHC